MSTLTGNKISLTYKSLIKTADNDVLTGALKELSDGLGNNSGVFLNTGGDLKSTGTLEFSNFKATAYAVTINKLVNEADGISNNDNDTSLPTSAAVKDYVDTHVTTQDLDFVGDNGTPGAVDLDSQSFNVLGTTNEIVTSSTGFTLTIGLPDDVTISGTYTGATFSGDLSGTINTATTATTQTAGDNSTKVATTAYVDTLDAASDLDFSDGTNNSAVNLNTQVLSIEGTSNEITTSASGQSLTVSLDSAGVDLPDNSTAITQTAGDNSTKVATTAYVDVLDAASDLDIAGDTGTGDVNLNTQTLTLQGTTNQVTTAVSGQTTTFSLPSTVHRNLQGNVTGDLTGNADTATAWQTARDLSLTNEATGTISSVDGTGNVSGSVTLLNSAVTAKVLTGLPTPSAGNIQASDTILQAFGKLQSQVSSISNGLIFKGSWDAATNTPTLTSGGGEVDQGTTTGQAANKLIDTSQNFNVTVSIGDKVINQVDGQSALVTVIDSNTQLSLDADIMLSSEAYTIDASPFIQQGQYYVVNYAGTTNLNGITDWSIGDWVIADADNRWSKLDHSQVDGQGSIGNLPVWTTANTLGDSIVSESGTALTVTGSLDTTLGASVTGDFAVNTDKFTVAAASGIVSTANDIFTAQNKGIFFNGASDFSSGIAGTSAGQGVRIFAGGSAKVTIDSSGNATFAGDVTANGIYSAGQSAIIYKAQRNGGAVAGDWSYDDATTDMSLGTSTSHSFSIKTGNTRALTIDSSQNSTFAGNVTVNKTTGVAVTDIISGDNYSVLTLQGGQTGDAANGFGIYSGYPSAGDFTIRENGVANYLTIAKTTGNATFAGNVKSNSTSAFSVGTVGNIGNTAGDINIYSTSSGHNGLRMHANGILPTDNAGTIIDNDADLGFPTYRFKDLYLGGSITGVGATFLGAAASGAPLVTIENNSGSTATSYGLLVKGGGNSASGKTFEVRDDNGNSDFIVKGNGKVGIQTNLPIGNFNIFGGTGDTTAEDVVQTFTRTSSTGNVLAAKLRLVEGASTTHADLKFQVKTTASSAENDAYYTDAITIKGNNANVGIGSDDPDYTLHLLKSSGNTEMYINGQNGQSSLRMGLDARNWQIKTAAAPYLWSLNYVGTDFQTSNIITAKTTGDVGIGTDDPLTDLHIEKDDASPVLLVKASGQTSSTAPYAKLVLAAGSASGADVGSNIMGYRTADFSSAAARSTGLKFGVLQNNVAKDAMWINEAGNVGIGENAPGTLLSLKGGADTSIITLKCTKNDSSWNGERIGGINFFSEDGSGAIGAGIRGSINYVAESSSGGSTAMTFNTGDNTERMRILNGGTVYIGDVTNSYGYSAHHIAKNSSQGYALIVRNTNTSTENNSVLQLNQATTGTNGYFMICRQGDPNSGTNRLFIYSNGNVQNVNNSYGAISDERLKENIVDATPKLDDLMKVKIRNYNFIGQQDKQIGVIAQEIENVFPSLVEDTKDPESEEKTKSVKYSVLVPIMLKAIQELKAEVDLLKKECKCK